MIHLCCNLAVSCMNSTAILLLQQVVTDFILKTNLEIPKSNEDNRNFLGKKKKKFDDCNFLRVEKISMIAISEV
ncbi:hypothetical protein CISIN_1g035091mg [Citrus sinensis]|uniref:Uncharacterized protein n=1 Tax=Citrus sinensis TaxID=2711 RepID=A0A067FE38_CITSI|nr:hypothetical protein CISIN_1g035091mg [Citrus sinensis]